MSFYEHAVIKDIIAFFRVVINKDDVEAIKRTINKPRRGIGDTTLAKVYSFVDMKNEANSKDKNSKKSKSKAIEDDKNEDNTEKKKLKLWDVLSSAGLFFKSRIVGLLQRYVSLIEELTRLSNEMDAYSFAQELISITGFTGDDQRKADKNDEDNDNELINDLLCSIKTFVDSRKKGEGKDLISYMQNLQLNNIEVGNTKEKDDSNSISLMTIHSAKGLEYKCVFIIGLEEGIFPLVYKNKTADIEEERRLFYVALTRAKEKVYISYSSLKYNSGKHQNTEKSMFLDEIKSEFVDDSEVSLNKLKNGQANKKNDYASYSMFKYSIVSRKISEGNSVVQGKIKPGVRVYHSMCGWGRISNVESGQNKNLIRAKFDQFEEEKTFKEDLSNLVVFTE